jgi:hypothetical protein
MQDLKWKESNFELEKAGFEMERIMFPRGSGNHVKKSVHK